MVRLGTHPEKYDGIKLINCGLLFLSTPHSGSAQADWNEYLAGLAELIFGVRSHAIIDILRTFNPQSTESREAFASLKPVPPFCCFVEGKRTRVLMSWKTV
jgi:hypothetical protein